jgi:hypothetical protein
MKKIVLGLIAIIFVIGCAPPSPNRLRSLRASMNMRDVKRFVGEPSSRRGELMNKYGQVIDVFEFELSENTTIGKTNHYWLFFINGKLVKWEEAIDWEESYKKIYETKFAVRRGLLRR